jgi:hypothetical protein
MTAWQPHDIRFVPAAPAVRATGMRGWVSFELGPLYLDSISVRRTREGRYRLSFGVRLDGNGVEHSPVRPRSNAARDEIEGSVLGELRKRGFIE